MRTAGIEFRGPKGLRSIPGARSALWRMYPGAQTCPHGQGHGGHDGTQAQTRDHPCLWGHFFIWVELFAVSLCDECEHSSIRLAMSSIPNFWISVRSRSNGSICPSRHRFLENGVPEWHGLDEQLKSRLARSTDGDVFLFTIHYWCMCCLFTGHALYDSKTRKTKKWGILFSSSEGGGIKHMFKHYQWLPNRMRFDW